MQAAQNTAQAISLQKHVRASKQYILLIFTFFFNLQPGSPSQTGTLARATVTFAARGVKSVKLIKIQLIYVFTKKLKT